MTDNKDTNTRLTILNTFTGETIADGLNAEESVKIFLKLAESGMAPLVITSDVSDKRAYQKILKGTDLNSAK